MELLAAQYSEVEAQIQDLQTHCAPALLADFVRVCALSDFVRQQVMRDPTMIRALLESQELVSPLNPDFFTTQLQDLKPASLDVRLREFRQRAMVRIIFRDLTRLAQLEETTSDLSDLADRCIDAALSVHYAKNLEKFGEPIGDDTGQVQQMAVLALGKLGARELNVSSDIDLIFFYDEPGMVASTGREMTNQEFFIRTSQDVIRSLDANLHQGFVFRVDMRLRPYGESGALILNSASMEKYFYEQGRDWERYAFVKARAAAGDVVLGEQFLLWLRPFIYRKYLDYSAIDALREMKRMINIQVSRKDMLDDVKLGPGGIREIEFIVQALQLIWGGREAQLQERRILHAMTLLAAGEFLPAHEVEQLRSAYYFLRNCEHAIQAEKDRQTQALPTADLSRQRLADAMGFASYEIFIGALQGYRQSVTAISERFMSSNRADKEEVLEGNLSWASIWREPSSERTLELLVQSGYLQADEVSAELQEFSQRMHDRDLQEIGLARLNRLMPVLLGLAARQQDPDKALARLLPIVDQIARRSTYIVYLLENLDALQRMTHLCGMSPWVAARLSEMPILLYELSDRNIDEAVFEKSLLAVELQEQLSTADSDDLEAQMDLLRQFKNAAVLKVAVFELLDVVPLMKASDALTVIAEVVLDKAIDLAWQNMVARFGYPCAVRSDVQGEGLGSQFAIVAYGKLGGFELGYGSDLDLVMLYDADPQGETNGQKQIENSVFFHRMAQRVIHILTRYTRFGTVYEVDLRLRPSGNKGPLIGTFNAYGRYLAASAWTWELQALVRARFVAGHPDLRGKFDLLRGSILQQPRDRAALLAEVVLMREKMRTHLKKKALIAPPSTAAAQDVTQAMSAELNAKSAPSARSELGDEVLVSGFDLKHGAGAIVDIEFMVQFAVLASAHEHPEVVLWSDKVRLLSSLEAIEVFNSTDRQLLHDAYIAYRSAVHYEWLGGEMQSFERLNEYREAVVDIWQRCMSA
jgi:glutamate-ammonia-ligase adenylyltransferase